ncbi:MAG: pyridoxamine 5'-phosphate oxidase [Microscillaceae bacterium]|nr:pyridoxamine 5'-phosphate oxidase [Microscillaceae bacterium]MDW8460020.1 pyridoxamine 5'-phosphate oxidase [Cytophagales bacterium]
MLSIEKIANLRKEYTLASLDIADVPPNPLVLFEKWFQQALDSQVLEANAMFLATVDAENKPSGRVVLLKGIENGNFLFYTNYLSRKGQEIAHNPHVCLTFFWAELERQVRIEGTASQASAQTSDNYFHSRPRDSQIGAWVSPQSQVIQSRDFLEKSWEFYVQQFSGKELIQRPPYWGGYAVSPQKIEFWQGRPSRLHDRILYTLQSDNTWKIERLAP